MAKLILSDKQVGDLIAENKYKLDPSKKYMSRCIDGRYENAKDLAVQAFPGGDLGELAMVLATANAYGFEVDREKVFEVLVEVVGGKKNFSFHTDTHGDPKKLASGCGHYKQINLDPAAYKITQEDIAFINAKLKVAKDAGSEEVLLEGPHMEGAILLVSGNWGIYPRYELNSDQDKKLVQVFVYHQSLTDEKHRELAKKLVSTGAVKFKLGEDAEYLYQVMSEVTENHLMETAKRLAPDLPVYNVKFDADGSFEMKKT